MSTNAPDPSSASPIDWEVIRTAYCAGEPAKDAGAPFGVSPSTVYRRARKGGWRRKDLSAESHKGRSHDPRNAAETILRAAAAAIAREDYASAQDLAILAERLARAVKAVDAAWPKPAPDETYDDIDPKQELTERLEKLANSLARERSDENGADQP